MYMLDCYKGVNNQFPLKKDHRIPSKLKKKKSKISSIVLCVSCKVQVANVRCKVQVILATVLEMQKCKRA